MNKPLCSLCGKPIPFYPRTKGEREDMDRLARGEKMRGKPICYICPKEEPMEKRKWYPWEYEGLPVYHFGDCKGVILFTCDDAGNIIDTACSVCQPDINQLTLPNIPADRQNFI